MHLIASLLVPVSLIAASGAPASTGATVSSAAPAFLVATTQEAPLRGGLFGPSMEPAEMAKAIAAASAFPLGSEQNPVRVDMPAGERAYLARLRCADERIPQFARSGSVGVGVYGNILDLYDVSCGGSTPGKSAVYMDMYFPEHIETAAIPGFTIVAP